VSEQEYDICKKLWRVLLPDPAEDPKAEAIVDAQA
jgi:hypothetical protein